VYLEKKGGKVVVVCGYPEIQKKFEDFFNQ